MNFTPLPDIKETSLKTEYTSIQEESLTGGEAAFASAVPNIYALSKTVSDFVPYMWTLFPSGRQEFQEKGLGMKALSLGIDTVSLVPATLLFKGVKSIIQSGKFGSWLLGTGTKPLKSLSVLDETIPIGSKWEAVSVLEKARSKWKIPEDEAKQLLESNAKPELWKQVTGPSGAFVPRKPSVNYSKLFQEGKLKDDIKKQLDYWEQTPLVKQRKDFYLSIWKDKITSVSGGGEPNFNNMFEYQISKFFGEEVGKKYSLENASSKVMANLLLDTIEHPRSIRKQLDIGYHWITPTDTLPARKAFGGGERMFGTYSSFERLKSRFKDVNEYQMQQYTNFITLLSERGFGELVKSKFGGKEIITGFKRSKEFTKEIWEDYGKTAVEMDRMRSVGQNEVEIANYLKQKPEILQRLMTEVHKPFHDDLYKDDVLTRIPQILMDKGLSDEGFKAFSALWEGENGKGVAKILSSYLDSNADLQANEVMSRVGAALDLIKLNFKPSWLSPREAEALKFDAKDVIDKLTFSSEGRVGFPAYLDNYAIRISKTTEDITDKRLSLISRAPHANYVKTRLMEEHTDLVDDPIRMLQARIGQQARELWLNPYLTQELKDMKKLPEGYKLYFDYWLGRMMGQPTGVDARVAQWLTTSIGGLNKLFHQDKIWTSKRVNDLAYKINDIVYKGALSFRPFAATRNTFQMLLTVPTDMGGIKDLYWLMKGYAKGVLPETQAYIQKIGAITDYLEDIKPSSVLPKFGMSIGRRELPSSDKLWDVGMWLFKGSDRFSRYVTGGAVLAKWEHYAQKFLTPANYKPDVFARKMNIHLRDDWVRRQLEDTLSKLPKAPTDQLEIDAIANIVKDKLVSDVIADTQWLYGVADSPLITGKYGVISKTGTIFQTWWMNYITQLQSWFLKRGTPADKMDRFFTWMVSSAIAGELMVHAAGFRGSQARGTILGGPIPTEVSPMLIPPTWAPFYYSLKTVAEYSKLSPDLAKQSLKSLGRSLTLAVPGGIVGGQAIRGYDQDKWEGLARGIFNYYGGTGETLLKE